MKTLITAALLALAAPAFATGPSEPDTIIVKLKKSDKLMLITRPGQTGVRGLKEYDLNQLMRKIDSALQGTQSMTMTNGLDTTLSLTRIQTKPDESQRRIISISLNTKKGTRIIVQERYEYPDSAYRYENHRFRKGRYRPSDFLH